MKCVHSLGSLLSFWLFASFGFTLTDTFSSFYKTTCLPRSPATPEGRGIRVRRSSSSSATQWVQSQTGIHETLSWGGRYRKMRELLFISYFILTFIVKRDAWQGWESILWYGWHSTSSGFTGSPTWARQLPGALTKRQMSEQTQVLALWWGPEKHAGAVDIYSRVVFWVTSFLLPYTI